MNKTAIVIFSDPKSGADEALGRVLNGLAAAYDYQQGDGEVKVIFQGAGTRWPAELQKPEHPANKVYQLIEKNIEGVSSACADVFGATPSGLDLIKNNPLPGTSGISSFKALHDQGYQVLTF